MTKGINLWHSPPKDIQLLQGDIFSIFKGRINNVLDINGIKEHGFNAGNGIRVKDQS